MARTAEALRTDITRIEEMLASYNGGNQDTVDILEQTLSRLEGELDQLTRPSRATRQTSIDAATVELIDYENEANVSRELKAAIQNSRGDLVRRRENA